MLETIRLSCLRDYCRAVAAVLCTLSHITSLSAQRPTVCGPDAKMELKCADACIICDIDGFRGRNNNGGQINEGDRPPSFCTSVNHNIQWIGFLAGSSQLTIELAVSGCEDGNRPDGGLEAGIFEVLNCDVPRSVVQSECDSDIGNNTTQVFNMETLVPGNFYYLIIDGNNGDICNYDIRVTRGTTKVPEVNNSGNLRGPQRICQGRAFTYQTNRVPGAPYYDWTLNGQAIGTETDLAQTITFPSDGDYQLCVTASNLCNVGPQECLNIRVGDFSPTRVVRSSCNNEAITVDGRTFTTTAEYPVLLQSRVGCDSTVIYDIRIADRITSSFDTTICAGKTLLFNGQVLSAAGPYSATIQLPSGCDSTVTVNLALTSCGYEIGAQPSNVGCAGGADGAIDVSVIGPGAPYTLRYRRVGDPGYTSFGLEPNGQIVRIPNLRAGSYELIWRDVYDAEQTRSITITEPAPLTVALQATLRFGGFNISCPGARDGEIRVTTQGGTAPYTYRWEDGSTAADRLGLAAGNYRLEVVDARGCRQNLTIALTAPAPIAVTDVALETCANEPVDIGGQLRSSSGVYNITIPARSGCDSLVRYTLTVHPLGASSLDSTICIGWTVDFFGRQLSQAGVYTQTLATVHGCDSVVTLRLQARSCAYEVSTRTENVACAGQRTGVIWIAVDGSEPMYELSWRNSNAALSGRMMLRGDSTPVRLDSLPADVYSMTVTDVFGVQASATPRITAPSPLFTSLASERRGDFDISCAGRSDGRLLATVGGGTPPYRYEWSNGQTSAEASGLSAGQVTLNLIDAKGCVRPSVYTLREPEPVEFVALPLRQGCDPDDEPGGVEVSELTGGQSPYRVLLNSGRPNVLASTYTLDTGQHEVTVVDAQGCTAVREVMVGAPERPTIEVDVLARMLRGDSLRLAPRYIGDIVRYDWAGDASLSCTDCPNPTVRPDSTSIYTVVVTNADGCTATAQLRLNVGINTTIYTPTAFSPNGDGANDGLTIFTAEPGSIIEELQVFDRWGEQVFAKADFAANEPALGWDGTFRGEHLNPAVFVYWARVRIPDVGVELVKSEVMLVR